MKNEGAGRVGEGCWLSMEENEFGGIMVKDTVCGMQVDEAKAASQTNYKGKSFYSCGTSCKDKFVKDPQKYAEGKSSSDCCK